MKHTDSIPFITFVLYRDAKEQRTNAEKLKNLLDLPVTEVALKGDNLNPVRTFLDLPKEPRQAIFYTFLGSSLPEGKSDFDKFAGYVNIQREAFEDAPHAVVLWLREEQLVRLMRRAPDFWAWRSGVFDMRGELEVSDSTYRELEEINTFERESLEEQIALYREILKSQLKRDEPDLAYIARTRLRLSSALHKLGLYEAVVQEASEVVEIARTLNGDQIRLTALNNLATAYMGSGRYEEAESIYREAIGVGAKVLGREHPEYATTLNNLAGLLEATGRFQEAEFLFREAAGVMAKALGKEHPEYATVLSNLAGLLESSGRYKEAETLYHESIKIDAKVLGKEHLNYATRLNNLAELLRKTGRFEEAEPLYLEAIDIVVGTLGKAHPNYASAISNLAGLLDSTGRHQEAESLYRESLEIDARTLGKEHPNYATGLSNLAGSLIITGQYVEAEPLLREALSIFLSKLGEDHPSTQTAQLLLRGLEQQKASAS